MKSTWLVLVALAACATASTKLYDVPPCRCYNGWTANDGNVAQEFVACADTLLYAEFFAGQMPEHSEYGHLVQVLEGGTVLFQGNADDQREWAYVRADLERQHPEVPFVRGKTYLLKVSHTGAQPVNYFYDPNDPYEWGEISVGGGGWGQPEPVQDCDLTCP